MPKVDPFLMFSVPLDEPLALYRSMFPDLQVKASAGTGGGEPLRSAEFTLAGQTFRAFNGGPHFTFSEGFSVFVECADQAEVDRFWDRLVEAGSTPTQCGWIRDPYGLSWQIVPRRFIELTADPDPRKVQAVIDAMLKMQKLEVAELERVHAEA